MNLNSGRCGIFNSWSWKSVHVSTCYMSPYLAYNFISKFLISIQLESGDVFDAFCLMSLLPCNLASNSGFFFRRIVTRSETRRGKIKFWVVIWFMIISFPFMHDEDVAVIINFYGLCSIVEDWKVFTISQVVAINFPSGMPDISKVVLFASLFKWRLWLIVVR